MVGQDILDGLRTHFGQDAEWIYSVAMLRTAKHCAFRYIDHFYHVSYLSMAMGDLPLFPGSLSNWMEQLGTRRSANVAFMRDFPHTISTPFLTAPPSSAIRTGYAMPSGGIIHMDATTRR